MDPMETEETATTRKYQEPWNGEFYASFGEGERCWEDALKYGFISGGGGNWYSRTLSLLTHGDRVWVNIPQTGYVGVGIVQETAKKADEVFFTVNNDKKNIYDLSGKANYYKQYLDDDDRAEYLVKVDWLKAVKRSDAVREVGFFGNQNTVCKPTTQKWNHTVDRLKIRWGIE